MTDPNNCSCLWGERKRIDVESLVDIAMFLWGEQLRQREDRLHSFGGTGNASIRVWVWCLAARQHRRARLASSVFKRKSAANGSWNVKLPKYSTGGFSRKSPITERLPLEFLFQRDGWRKTV